MFLVLTENKKLEGWNNDLAFGNPEVIWSYLETLVVDLVMFNKFCDHELHDAEWVLNWM
jgi:hypothetical protein